MYSSLFLILLLLIVSFLYSSVGHGGASGYIAVLTLWGIVSQDVKSTALILNVLVSSIAFFYFYKKGYFNWHFFWPFAISSIPLAFLGATIQLSDGLYKRLLGICLIFAILKLVGVFDFFSNSKNSSNELLKPSILLRALIGGLIGFLSGMLGIGGGIILSPLILIFGWANMKQTAAASALFILVNSIAGLLGVFQTGFSISSDKYFWIVGAFFGGILGGYLGSSKFNFATLRYILALVLFIASIKLVLI